MPNFAGKNKTNHLDMRRLSLVIMSALLTLTAAAQTAWDEIRQNPKLAAGKYFAYEPHEPEAATPPEGYAPFYVSAFARHGSRYLTDREKYTEPMAALAKADSAGCLTADGRRALDIIKAMYAEAEGRYGELTKKGAEQHRLLVDRMAGRWPEVFADGVHVDARSTTKSRAFLSMANGCVELARLNPELRITMDASLKDVPYIKYKSKAYDKQHLTNQDEVYRRADSAYVHPARLMAQLFTGTAYVRGNIASPTTLMQQLFELDGISQSSYGMPSLGFLFTPEERYDLWQRNNFEWYYEKGASPLSDGCMYKLGRNMLENFVLTADTVIASGNKCVTLRYGHDTQLAPFAALMGCGELTRQTTDWQRIADTYRTYRIIPMCGNVQMAFYRKAGTDDILVRVLLNERDADLPVATDCAPFYHWQELRAYWMNTINAITLPPVKAEED